MPPTAPELLDRQYLEMRGRILALAADFDRIGRADPTFADARLDDLRACLTIVLTDLPNRADAVQRRLSDTTPPPG